MLWPQLPDYGCIARWPQDGQGFIHPDDVPKAKGLIPSERVLRRDFFDGTYYHVRYGSVRIRLRPCLWLTVRSEGLDIGDEVETVGQGFERELFVAKIAGMYYVRRKGRILYRLARNQTLVPKLFLCEQLRLLRDKAKVKQPTFDYPEPKDFAKDKHDRLPL